MGILPSNAVLLLAALHYFYNSEHLVLISARAKGSSALRDMKTTKRTARNKFYFLAATSISFLGSTESYHKKISFTIILKQNISKKNIESNA